MSYCQIKNALERYIFKYCRINGAVVVIVPDCAPPEGCHHETGHQMHRADYRLWSRMLLSIVEIAEMLPHGSFHEHFIFDPPVGIEKIPAIECQSGFMVPPVGMKNDFHRKNVFELQQM